MKNSLLLWINCIKIIVPILLIASLSTTESEYENYIVATSESVSNGQQYYELLPYENSTFGIYAEYPDDWDVVTPSNVKGDRTLQIVEFWSPDGTGVVSIYRNIFDIEESMDTYLAEILQSYSNFFNNFTLIASDNIVARLADNPGYSLLYSYNQDETGLMFLAHEVGTIIPNTDIVFYIEYNAPLRHYASNEQIADEIIASLEFHIQLPKTETGQTPELGPGQVVEGVGEI